MAQTDRYTEIKNRALALLEDGQGFNGYPPGRSWVYLGRHEALNNIGVALLTARDQVEARAREEGQPYHLTKADCRKAEVEIMFEVAKREVDQALPRNTDTIKALRWILKSLLRRHGYRCIDIHSLPTTEPRHRRG